MPGRKRTVPSRRRIQARLVTSVSKGDHHGEPGGAFRDPRVGATEAGRLLLAALGWKFDRYGETPYWVIDTGDGAIGNVAGQGTGSTAA
jgi:hypothetical protein